MSDVQITRVTETNKKYAYTQIFIDTYNECVLHARIFGTCITWVTQVLS